MCKVRIDETGKALLRGVFILLLLLDAGFFLASVAPGAITENDFVFSPTCPASYVLTTQYPSFMVLSSSVY